MHHALVTVLGVLAASSLAVPSPQGPVGASSPPPIPPQNTSTPTPTGDISIPLASILAAPIIDLPPENTTFVSVPGGSNSTLVDIRPDLQEYVDNATLNTTKNAKRSLQKRVAHSEFCANPSGAPSLTQATWEAIAAYICQGWYPTPGALSWDVSSAYPNTLKHSTLTIGLGGGAVVHVDFSYGVNDWGTQAGFGWQPFYVPGGQSLCISDLHTLIGELFGPNANCLVHTGYDTSGIDSDGVALPFQIFDGTGQPKWYAFKAS